MDTGILLVLRGQVEEDLVRALAAEPGLAVVRRCADLAELTAAVLAGLGTVAVVEAGAGVDRTLVDRLRSHGARTIVSCESAEVARFDALGAFGLAQGVDMIPAIRSLADSTDEAERVLDVLGAAASEPGPLEADRGDHAERGHLDAPAPSDPATRLAADPATGLAPDPAALGGASRALPGAGPRRAELRARRTGPGPAAAEPLPEYPPRLVVVTGAPGSPGRSTIAINLAQELATCGAPVVLIDADLWGGAIAQSLGLLADTAGLSAAVRAADNGTLDVATFARLAPRVGPRLRVLPGLARASRWREVSAASTEAVLHTARLACPWVVVEAPVLVPEEETGYGLGPARNDVARGLLGAADEIVVVGAGEPIGIERLVQALLDLDDVPAGGNRRVLVNRLRTTAAGPRARDSVREALARFAGVQDPVLIPDDRAICDRALLAGITWREAGGRSAARAALAELAGDLLAAAGAPTPATPRGPARWLPGQLRGPGRAAAH